MPSRNSIINKTKEKKPFAPVDNAIKLYNNVLNMCIRMPKKYTFFIGQDLFKEVAEILGHAKIANSIMFKEDNLSEARRRILNWRQAREHLQAFSSKFNALLSLKESFSNSD